MTVLIEKEPQKRYQSLVGSGSTQADRDKADKLDLALQKSVNRLISSLTKKNLVPESKGKGSQMTYWEVGNTLRKVVEKNKDIFNAAELPLFWKNAKIYLPETLLYKDRGPYREHLWYCYRLASFSKKLAGKINWSEWVTILDSAGINQERRFDAWFIKKLSDITEKTITRKHIRIFAPCVNKMLNKIETDDLTEEELNNCYEAAWCIMQDWIDNKNKDKRYSVGREELQNSIKVNFIVLDGVMNGDRSPKEFAKLILETAKI